MRCITLVASLYKLSTNSAMFPKYALVAGKTVSTVEPFSRPAYCSNSAFTSAAFVSRSHPATWTTERKITRPSYKESTYEREVGH